MNGQIRITSKVNKKAQRIQIIFLKWVGSLCILKEFSRRFFGESKLLVNLF